MNIHTRSELVQWTKGHKYWDKAWNPVVGCLPCSEGCDNCYAKAMCLRFDINGNGKFEPTPKKSRPPKSGVVFIGNMSDLFGDWNDDHDIIDWTFETWPFTANLFLTKRAARLASLAGRLGPVFSFPLATFYGITTENQTRFDERFPHLCRVSREHPWWLSCEPLLGPIDLTRIHQFEHPDNEGYGVRAVKLFRWVVVGAESGSKRRPCKLEWVEEIVETCLVNRVPVFVKQLDMNGKLIKDIDKFPEDLRIRQVPWVNAKMEG